MGRKAINTVFKITYYDIDGKRRIEYEPVYQKNQRMPILCQIADRYGKLVNEGEIIEFKIEEQTAF